MRPELAGKMAHTIWELRGSDPAAVHMLVHVAPAEAPDDIESYSARVFRRNGPELQLQYKVDEWVQGMWQSPSGKLYAVSSEGTVHQCEDGRWSAIALGREFLFNGVWGWRDETVYVCGQNGVLFRKEGARWDQVTTGVDDHLLVVEGSRADDVYLLGLRGKIFHFDGSRLSELESPTNRKLIGLLCVADDEIYAAGRNGVCLRGNREGWEVLEAPETTLWSLARYGESVLVGAREEGVWRIDGSSLVPFALHVKAHGLRTVGRHLFGWWDRTLFEFDGTSWTRTELDFGP